MKKKLRKNEKIEFEKGFSITIRNLIPKELRKEFCSDLLIGDSLKITITKVSNNE